MKIEPRSWVYPLLLAAVAGAAAFFLVGRWDRPLVADEPQTSDIARALAATARPLAYERSDWNVVFIHPTLYYALVAAPVAIFGPEPWAARLPGVLALFATVALLWFTVRRVTGERWGPFVAVALYALHPLAVQSALLLDMDAALLPLAAAFLVWYLARRDFSLGGAGWVGLGLIFGVSLLAKMTTPPLLVIALALHFVITGRFRRLAPLVAAATLGVAVFIVYFVPYGALQRLPVLKPFFHLLGPLYAARGVGAAAFLGRGLRLLLWFGAPVVVAFGFAVAAQIRGRLRAAPPAVLFATVATLVVAVFYLVVGGEGYGFVKYHAPLVPLVALILGAVYGPALGRESARTVLIFGVLAFVYYLLAVRDPLYKPYVANEMADVFGVPSYEITRGLTLTGVFLVLPLLGALAVVRPRGWAMAFVVLAAAAGPALDAWQRGADYSTNYNYGERGLNAAARMLDAVPETDAVVVPVDVAYADRYRHPHVAVEEVLPDAAKLRAVLQAREAGAVVLRDSYFVHGAYRAALADYRANVSLEGLYTISRRGSFTVALRKNAPP